MAVVSNNGNGLVIDRAKSVQSFVWNISAGPNSPVTITPAESHQGFVISNDTANYLRVQILFAPGITSATPLANRTHLVPPGKNHAIDLGSKHAGDSLANHPIAGIQVEVVDPPAPGALVDSSTLSPGIAAAGVVTFNFASA